MIGFGRNRAIQWRRRGNEQRAASFCKKVIDFLELIKEDPKTNIEKELNCCIEKLKDYFFPSILDFFCSCV